MRGQRCPLCGEMTAEFIQRRANLTGLCKVETRIRAEGYEYSAKTLVIASAVQAIDRRRLSYVEGLMTQSGLSADVARARAQILYWAFLGFALADQKLPKARQQAVLDEMLRIAAAR